MNINSTKHYALVSNPGLRKPPSPTGNSPGREWPARLGHENPMR
jgi:hypothetical protein